MRGARAFTIIEFTIAIAVATIIGLAAVSRFNSYLRQQEFNSGGQAIANCLQRASTQAQVGAYTNPPRFMRATIVYDSVTPQVTCEVEAQPLHASNGTENTTSQLLIGNPLETGTSQIFRANNTRLSTGTTERVVFGALENGMPLGLSLDGIISRQPDDAGIPSTYTPFGSGFALDGSTNIIRLNSDTTSSCGIITMPPTGTPVHFELLNACL